MNPSEKTIAVQSTFSSRYLIETEYFAVSDEGIHLLRERFNYQTISWQDIHVVRIHRDRDLHNWFAVFCISAVMIIAGVYYASEILDTAIETSRWSLLRMYALILLTTLCGVYFFFKSVRKGWVLKIRTKTNKKLKFPLEEVYEQKQMKQLEGILKKNFARS